MSTREDILKALDADGIAEHGGVNLELWHQHGPAWVVFAGVDSEEEGPVAILLGERALERAEALLIGYVVPAVVLHDGRLIVANHVPAEEGVAVLEELFGFPVERWMR